MKSLVFKLGVVLLAVVAVKTLVCTSIVCSPSSPTRPAATVLVHPVIHTSGHHAVRDEVGPVTYIEGQGGRVVVIDGKGVSVASLVDGDQDNAGEPVVRGGDRRGVSTAPDPRRVAAEGLPVPVVEGTRVSEAEFEPPDILPPGKPHTVRPVPVVEGTRVGEAEFEAPDVLPPGKPRAVRPPRKPTPPRPPARVKRAPQARPKAAPNRQPYVVPIVVAGRLSATEERARNDARLQLERMLADRLSPEVPPTWKIPPPLVDSMVREIRVIPRERDYGTVYEASLTVDASPQALSRITTAYHRQQIFRRLGVLGGGLAFVLACLAAISGYIKADEATKGYYTSRLRLAALAGVGVAGVVIYKLMTRT
jgi:hypothetical protein